MCVQDVIFWGIFESTRDVNSRPQNEYTQDVIRRMLYLRWACTEHRVTAVAAFRCHVERTLRAAAEALPARASGEHKAEDGDPETSEQVLMYLCAVNLELCGAAALKYSFAT